MGRTNRFVKPDVVRVDISEGDWIEIKKQLTVGEEKQVSAKSIRQMGGRLGEEDARWDIDPAVFAFARVEAYLVDWSFAEEDDDGNLKPVELTAESIRALDEASFNEIDEAIDKHIKEFGDASKKATGGKRKPGKK